MDKKILDFIKKSRVSVLATVLVNGSPHVAAMHYSHGDNPLEIYFSVDKTSLKCQLLLKKKKCQASVVIGFSEQDWLTLQMDGLISIVGDREELKTINELYGYLRLYTNFFQPVMKLIEKTRIGSKVQKKYDRAQTPFKRVLDSSYVSQQDKDTLIKQYAKLNPAELKRQITKLQHKLMKFVLLKETIRKQSNYLKNKKCA